MNILLAIAWAAAVLAIIIATGALVATNRARKEWIAATWDAQNAQLRADQARRRHDEARKDLDAQRKFYEAGVSPAPMKIEPGTHLYDITRTTDASVAKALVQMRNNDTSAAAIMEENERRGKAAADRVEAFKRKPTLIRHAPHIQPRREDSNGDPLTAAIMAGIIAESTITNHVPDQITVTDTGTITPTPDTSSSSSYDSGSSSSSSDCGGGGE